jgi:hypothetical protein
MQVKAPKPANHPTGEYPLLYVFASLSFFYLARFTEKVEAGRGAGEGGEGGWGQGLYPNRPYTSVSDGTYTLARVKLIDSRELGIPSALPYTSL